jgi:Delta7-sterol 5-desaturase
MSAADQHISWIVGLIYSNSPFPLMLSAIAYFCATYTFLAFLVWVLARAINRPLDAKPVSSQQLRSEWRHSLRSLSVMGAGMIVPWLLVQFGLAKVHSHTGFLGIVVVMEWAFLVLWNELHFYAVHRLLHEKLNAKHLSHHRHEVVTPFAAYSMSITEALLLGSVLPLAMCIYDFSAISLMLLVMWSMLVNVFGHSNCDLFPAAGKQSALGFIRHHQHHHAGFHGNYGFFLSQLDRWLGTSHEPNYRMT